VRPFKERLNDLVVAFDFFAIFALYFFNLPDSCELEQKGAKDAKGGRLVGEEILRNANGRDAKADDESSQA
jgi:hypothetical protein